MHVCAYQGADTRVRPYTQRTDETATWYKMAGPAGFPGGCPYLTDHTCFSTNREFRWPEKKTRGNPDPGFPRKIKESGSDCWSFP